MWDAFGLLAKWFHFPPSEIYAMEWRDLEQWAALAAKQIQAAGKN